MTDKVRYARVALNIPVDTLFDYRIPVDLDKFIEAGMRVRVPFGYRKSPQMGICVEVADETDCPPKKIKPVMSVVDETPLLDAEMLELARWVADRYLSSWGEALAAVLPAAIRKRGTAKKIRYLRPAPSKAYFFLFCS